MPLIDGPANAVSYFAANAKSTSLRKKMKALALSGVASADVGGTPSRLAETRLRELVHRDSKPISARSSQSSSGGDTIPPSLDHDNSRLGVFSEISIGEEMLLPGDWPLSQVALLSAEGVGTGFGQELEPPPGTVGDNVAGWNHPSEANPFQPCAYTENATVEMDVLDIIQTQQCGIPAYFNAYHDRLVVKAERLSGIEDPCPSQDSVLHRMCKCGRIFACEDGSSEGAFTCGLHDL